MSILSGYTVADWCILNIVAVGKCPHVDRRRVAWALTPTAVDSLAGRH